jgi:hypothetical protein
MASVLARIRDLSRRTIVAIAAGVVVVFALLVALLGSPEDVLGVLGLALYIVAILGLSAAVTFAVVKLSPGQKKPKDASPS